MASHLGPVAARRHVAPAPACRSRVVVEHVATLVVRADPEARGVAARDRLDEGFHDPRERLVGRIPQMPMPDAETVGADRQLDGRRMTQGVVDDLDRLLVRAPSVGLGLPGLAERGSKPANPLQPDLLAAIELSGGTLELVAVGEAAVDEEVDRSLRVGQGVVRAAVLRMAACRAELERVDEIEARLEIRRVGVARLGLW